MKKFLFILLFVLPFTGFAQQNSEKDSTNERIYTSVDVQPVFPGGDDEFYKYILKNIKYPKKERKKNIQGKVYLTFVISEVGKIMNAKVLRGVSKSIDEEALRVLNSMPTWKPGTRDGRAVRVQLNVPINFSLK